MAPVTGRETPRPLRVVFITQAVDRDDPTLPHSARWIEALARKPGVEHVAVLALRTGRHELPGNVSVRRFGRPNRLATVGAFYRAVVGTLRRRPDVFFVHQGGPYPLLLMPFKLVARIPIVQWKTHGVITRAMAFYARRCDDLLFTATRASFPMPIPKVRVVGHGIDTDAFRSEAVPTRELIAAGRIAPTKRIEEMVLAVEHANRRYGTAYRLDIYGPTLPGDERYAAAIDALIDRLGARERVTIHGPVGHAQLPRLFNGHRACLNFSDHGAIDKAALEAMACGRPVISTNDSVAEIMPPALRPLLITDRQSTEVQAAAIHELLSRPDAELGRLGERMRAVVVADHSVDRLFERVLEDIRAVL